MAQTIGMKLGNGLKNTLGSIGFPGVNGFVNEKFVYEIKGVAEIARRVSCFLAGSKSTIGMPFASLMSTAPLATLTAAI